MNSRKILLATGLCLLITLSIGSTAKAEWLDETVTNVSVPGKVLWDVQGTMQGYILYSVKETPSGYTAVVARDSEPHQFPTFTYLYNKNWDLLNKTGGSTPQPKIDAPIPEPPKPEPVPMPRAEPPREMPETPRVEPKPQPPVIVPEPVVPEPPRGNGNGNNGNGNGNGGSNQPETPENRPEEPIEEVPTEEEQETDEPF